MCFTHTPSLKENTLSWGILLVRIGIGLIFLAHGAQKLQNIDNVITAFGSIGFSAFFAYLVAAVEFLGGLAMLLGIFTDIAGALLAIVMIVAIYKVKFVAGFLGGYEFDVILLLAAIGITLTGPGKYAIPCCFGKCETGKQQDEAKTHAR